MTDDLLVVLAPTLLSTTPEPRNHSGGCRAVALSRIVEFLPSGLALSPHGLPRTYTVVR